MKKIIAWILLAVMLLGMLAGCKKDEGPATEPTGATAPAAATIEDVIEYLKTIYKDDGAKTPVDFERFGVVRIAGIPFEVVWTASVGEDLVKIVVNDDGTVTIDVNEQCDKDTEYTLTATVTDESGKSVSHSWKYLLPQAVDMVAIVKEAYALENGQSLPYESTLTGEIISIDTAYSAEYKNITVTIRIAGAEDMPIQCYRLKGEGADQLAIGDIITVTGTLKNYNGTIEFDAGCTLDAVIPGERVKAPEDPKQIVDEAYKLGVGESLKYEATLTGEIISVDDAYSDTYGNITVTMVVEGRESKPIKCYRLKGDGAASLKVTDKITVTGYITNYNGTIEFASGCRLDKVVPGSGVYTPTDPKVIMADAKKLGKDQKTKYEATLTGVITEVRTPYSTTYGNVTVVMAVNGTSDTILCYRIKGAGADVIAEGDTITVKGYITNYMGNTIEFVAGSKLVSYKKAPKPEGPTVSYGGEVVTAPEADKAYKLGLVQKGLAGEPTLFFSGKVANSYYLGTTEDGVKAVDVVLKAVEGGYHLSFTIDGAVKYINAEQVTKDGKTHTNPVIGDTAATVWTYDTTLNTLLASFADGKYYIGTYGTYKTLSMSNVSYITGDKADQLDSYSFPSHLMNLQILSGPASMEEGVKQLQKEYPNGYGEDYKLPTSVKVRDDEFTITWTVETEVAAAVAIKDGVLVLTPQETATSYKLIATLTKGEESEKVTYELSVPKIPEEYVEAPQTATPYKLGLYSTDKEANYFFTGRMNGYYGDTNKYVAAAADVSLEAATGGYYLTFAFEGAKKYINLTTSTDANDPTKTYVNFTIADTAATVFTFNEEYDTLVAKVGDTEYCIGTSGTYTTLNTFKASNLSKDTYYPVRLYQVETVIGPSDAAKILDEAKALESGTALPYLVTLTGEVVSVDSPWSDQYKNITVTMDVNGTQVECYRMYAGKGTEDKIAGLGKGDTITVTGALSNYKGDLEFSVPALTAVTKRVVNAELAAEELAAKYPNGPKANTELDTKLTIDGVEFTVTWAVTEGAPAAAIVDGKLVLTPQNEDTAYTLVATVAKGEDTKTVTFNGEVKTVYYAAELVTTAPEAGVAYKLGLVQKGLAGAPVMLADGALDPESTHRLTTTEDLSNGADFYLEAVEGKAGTYYLYFLDENDAKKYINPYEYVPEGKTYTSGHFDVVDTPVNGFVYNAEWNILVFDGEDNDYFLGTYGTYSTISLSSTFYITGSNAGNLDKSQYPARFYTVKEVSGDATLEEGVEALRTVMGDTLANGTELSAAVKVRATEFTVTWAVTKGEAAAAIVDGKLVLTAQNEDVDWEVTATIAKGEETEKVTYTGTVEKKVEQSVGAYTMIDDVADLKAGTYYMGGYLTSYNNLNWEANPYHMFNGAGADLYTTPYAFANGNLTIKEGESYTAKTIELVAVDGKANTYYIKIEDKYLYSTEYNNRKLAVGTNPVEWVAQNNSHGGITMKTTLSEGDIHLGTAGANSKILRSYKNESTLKYGLVFFKENPQLIDKAADLKAGTYYMGGYLTSYNNLNWEANPYHMFNGAGADLYTTPYAFANGNLTIKEGESYTAKTIELVAVDGKANTYYIKIEDKYLYSTEYNNRKLAVGTEPVEWVAQDNSQGGITMKTTLSEGDIHLGTAGANSKILRSYKNESTLKYGLVFITVVG